jgi:hypothetical protein
MYQLLQFAFLIWLRYTRLMLSQQFQLIKDWLKEPYEYHTIKEEFY